MFILLCINVIYVTVLFSEVLYENEAFKHREMSALLASKLYYYLGSYEDSLQYALCAGSAFNVKESSEYVVTTICE